jgi:hypothetical protein
MVVAVVSSGSICALLGQPPLCLPGCDPRQRDFSARCPEAVSLVLISLVLLPRAFQLYWYANGAALFIPDQGYPSPAAVIPTCPCAKPFLYGTSAGCPLLTFQSGRARYSHKFLVNPWSELVGLIHRQVSLATSGPSAYYGS